MRTIKFRAWAVASRVMFKPDSENGWVLELGVLEPLSNTIVMQFTGLKDKNGKEIYEGDIVKTDYGVGEVKYHVCTFTIHGGSDLIGINTLYNCTDCGLGNAIKCEIIGNIYENPELLVQLDK